MRRASEHPVASLSFASSNSRPLAYGADCPVSLQHFRADVLRFTEQIQGDGDVLICCDGRYGFSVALLAAWLSTRAVILPPNRLESSLAHIRSHLPIAIECDRRWEETLKISPVDSGHGEWSIDLPLQNTAVRLFTSGSTGTPCIIPKSLGNLLHEAEALRQGFVWPEAPVVATVPPHHLYGLTFSLLLPWVLGVPWTDQTPFYPQDVINLVTDTGAGTLISIPLQYKALLREQPDFSHLTCVSAAAVLDSETARHWQQQQTRAILEIYGSTETGVVAHRCQDSDPAWRRFDAVSLSANTGLLQVTSPFVSEKWKGSFQTADRVKQLTEDRFQLLGRADSVVKIGGKRVCLAAIEQKLTTCRGVIDAAVLAVSADGPLRDKMIWAALVVSDEAALTTERLRKQLQGVLDGIEIPKRVIFVDKLPRTSSGKLPRKCLINLFK
ncbi:hypothetical protein MNBD_GAMMA13-799 [hydrothermal vent metagenome]|uniref:Long-chain-fatty-acid--CoA ligase n=1 Tax=hydrothermal vent metagenome TaxID=652676 RepID=A0A3B0YK94_9ZZZZ